VGNASIAPDLGVGTDLADEEGMTFFGHLTGRSKSSVIALAVASAAVLGGCGGAESGDPGNAGGSGGTGGGSGDDVQDYFDAMPDWGDVPEPSDEPSEPKFERRYLSAGEGEPRPFDCEVLTHDIVEKRDEILNFDSGAEYVKPGVMLVGNDFLKGHLSPIPLPRAGITLSINVPGVTTATVRIDDPNIGNIQQGIATLQAEAQKAANGSYAAQLSYEQHSVQSLEEMAYKLGVSASFDGLFANGAFSAKFENEEKVEKYTVVSKLLQQMYTITFSQDNFVTPRDFFSKSLTMSQLEGAEKNGFLGVTNVPVFIGSVTYGRMVVFSATSSQASSSQALQSTLQASGATWSASTELTTEEKSFLSTLDIEVLAVGGNQAEVSNAIKTGNWSELYSGADILNSVPLRYTVHALTGVRPIASIGDTTSYAAADCSAVSGWYDAATPPGTVFTDVSTNPTNDPVVAIGRNGSIYAPYRLEGEAFVQMPGFTATVPLQVAVDDVGNVFVQNASAGKMYRLPAGGSSFTEGPGGYLAFDAGGQDWLVALSNTYSDNQNDLYWAKWDNALAWNYWYDESQNMKYGQAPWFAAVTDGYIGRHGGGLYHRHQDGTTVELSADGAELDTVEKYTAAGASEIFALRKATGEVVRFDGGTKKFGTPITPPAGKSIIDLEATSAGRFWAVTSDGVLYGFAP
jgi:hypothetical protein